MWTVEEIERLVARIVERMRPRKVIVFGSYAKGTATIRSDLDLLVIQETDLPRARRADALLPMLAQLLLPVDVHVYTPEEVEALGREDLSFLQSILRSGRVVFSQ
jgi:predicted nucleotidyltransferase